MSYIHAVESNVVKYPYTYMDLLKDNPNVSFSINPTQDDLLPFNIFIVETTQPPAISDPRTQKIEKGSPEYIDNKWKESWSVRNATEEEIAQYDIQTLPPADWLGFKNALLSNTQVNLALLNALPNAPSSVIALPSTLMAISTDNNTEDFSIIWLNLLRLGLLTPEIISIVVDLAVEYSLPSHFIEILNSQ